MGRVTARHSANQRGYALLDIALALTIFAFAVTGMIVLMQKISETSGAYARDRLIQQAMDSFIKETKLKPVRDMTSEYYDETLDITLKAEVNTVDLANADGDSLEDLYLLKVTAEFEDAGGTQIEEAELYVYQPERK